jgi:threonine aldolase
MPLDLIDLRSDTVTRPSREMRAAIAEAEVGDDVFGEDPTVARLERMTADLLGKERALFVPTGTMANQIAIGVHVSPADEVLCSSTAHVYVWEGGAIARLWGATPRPIETRTGMLSRADLEGKIRPDDCHYVRTRLVCLENTHNRAGGRIHSIEDIRGISEWARQNGLAMHLDGARLMNAVVATGIPATEWSKQFDTVSICLSKGLGAPVGSVIAGTEAHIRKAHRLRKVLGGGMRQAGVIAAAGVYALQHNIERLKFDHEHAQLLAAAVRQNPGLELESGEVESNLVWISVSPRLGTAAEVAARLREKGVLVTVIGPSVLRACTHLDVSREEVERAAEVLSRV